MLAVVLGAGGVGWVAQWREAAGLRTELELARTETSELERLTAANARLKAQQVSVAELEALRADHAALPRLRAEIEALNKGAGAVAPAAGGK